MQDLHYLSIYLHWSWYVSYVSRLFHRGFFSIRSFLLQCLHFLFIFFYFFAQLLVLFQQLPLLLRLLFNFAPVWQWQQAVATAQNVKFPAGIWYPAWATSKVHLLFIPLLSTLQKYFGKRVEYVCWYSKALFLKYSSSSKKLLLSSKIKLFYIITRILVFQIQLLNVRKLSFL